MLIVKRLLLAVAFILVLAIAGIWAFLPTVNGPFLDFLLGRQAETPTEERIQSRFKLPEGFRVGLFATDVPNARMMQITEAGDLLVSSMRPGDVFLLHADQNGDGVADGRTLLVSDLDMPHGMAIKEGYLYIAEQTQISRGMFDAKKRSLGPLEVIFSGMPSGGNHRTRTLGFGPDGKLYVTVGSSCNVCIEKQPYRAEMLQMDADGGNARTYATGLRNTVGFDWQPGTGRLYGTDNGRDLLGDDIPHDELNLIMEGQDYGWPYAFEDRVPDPDYGEGQSDKIAASTPYAYGLGAHRGVLGIHFLDNNNSPDQYRDAALVAKHGSWNRSELAGYKVVSLHFDGDSITEKDFLVGFELDEDVIGRPVDIEQGPDGAIYISDDYAGAIYRVGFADIEVGRLAVAASELSDPLAELTATEKAELTDQGRQLFDQSGCAGCHIDSQSTGAVVQVKQLNNLASRFNLETMSDLIQAPPGPMPSYDFSEKERRALAVYLLTTY